MQSVEHVDAAVATATALSTLDQLPPLVSVSVEAAVLSADRSGGVMQSAEHVDAAVAIDGTLDTGPAAATCVGVSGLSRQQSWRDAVGGARGRSCGHRQHCRHWTSCQHFCRCR